MSNIFLSYSTKDRDSVTHLASDLEHLGYRIWFDRDLNRTGGQNWWANILEQIRSCDIFLFALTPKSLASDACQREYRYAHSLHKRVIPIMLTVVDIPSLPMELQELQLIDYRKRDTKQALSLASSLANLPPARPMPAPLPPEPELPLSPTVLINQRLGAESLTSNQQVELLFELEALLGDASTRTTAENLLRQLYTRPDLSAKVANKIEKLLPRLNRSDSNQPYPKLSQRGLLALGGAILLVIIGYGLLPKQPPDSQLSIVALPPTSVNRPGRIAFDLCDNSSGSNVCEIYVMNADGSNLKRITNNASNDRNPALSPDGKQIAFASIRDGNFEIFVMNADGTDLRRLTNRDGDDNSPAWSPDGQQIVFSSGDKDNIAVVNSDGSNFHTLGAVTGANPAWSPDGSYIAYTDLTVSRIYIANADGSNPRRLTFSEVTQQTPAWSPDGSFISFDSGSEVYIMPTNGGTPKQITHEGFSLAATWSPDGKQLAYSRDDGIYVINTDGTGRTKIADNKTYTLPSWSR